VLRFGDEVDRYYHKRKLPHIRVENMCNFITFRTHKSVDEYIKRVSNEKIENRVKQYKIDKYLDNSTCGAYFYDNSIAILRDILFEFDTILYQLYCFSIMPNHVHVLFEPKDDLSFIMKRIKGKSAKIINSHLNLCGTFWAREYYDKVIRNQKQFDTTVEYILNNPRKANLQDSEYRVYLKS
jgi:REP element-mobilizing transposase RayT